jgi:signal recognition particle subunit SEC65
MPPIHTQSSQKRTKQEGRILLTIQAIQKQEVTSLREAARQFNVPYSTLTTRLHGFKAARFRTQIV